jgi:hypothetical protein
MGSPTVSKVTMSHFPAVIETLQVGQGKDFYKTTYQY